MKPWTILCAGLALASERTPTQPPAPQAQTADTLAEKYGCLECHGVDRKVIGPAFRDIAAKYRNNRRARDALIQVVKEGGKGNWTEVTGGVLMPPYSRSISDADIRRLVDWVLSRDR